MAQSQILDGKTLAKATEMALAERVINPTPELGQDVALYRLGYRERPAVFVLPNVPPVPGDREALIPEPRDHPRGRELAQSEEIMLSDITRHCRRLVAPRSRPQIESERGSR